MNKFALIGRDISHSKSPEIYKKLISKNIQYDLLDYDLETEIPAAIELFDKYDGINITSPYKKHFLKEIKMSREAEIIGAVNCLKLYEGHVYGENTDYLAVVEILRELFVQNDQLEVVILGDGVMSTVAIEALKLLNITPNVFSRKKTKYFNQLNLINISTKSSHQLLVINTCSRDYVFLGELPSCTIFWDFNYNFPPHSQRLPSLVANYIDGLDLLERQASHAKAFWFHGLKG